MNILAEWQNSLLDAGSISFPKALTTKGSFTSLIGSRPSFAEVTVKFEPDDNFKFDSLLKDNDSETASYARAAILGMLDIFMTVHTYLISKVKITIVEINSDEVKSTKRAFRMAGRDAAKKALVESGLLKLQD